MVNSDIWTKWRNDNIIDSDDHLLGMMQEMVDVNYSRLLVVSF